MLCLCAFAGTISAQQPDPVERKVENPMTDAPNVNPLINDEPTKPRVPVRKIEGTKSVEELSINSDKQTVTGPETARVVVYDGNVDAHIGTFRIQADKITVFEATNRMISEGNVVFDQGDQQRITGSRAEWNYATKLGFFVNSTSFTNQTQDGTRIYFTADRIEKVNLTTYIATNAELTACDQDVPKWSFTTKRAVIVTGDRIRIKGTAIRVKKVRLLAVRAARASGFRTRITKRLGIRRTLRFETTYTLLADLGSGPTFEPASIRDRF